MSLVAHYTGRQLSNQPEHYSLMILALMLHYCTLAQVVGDRPIYQIHVETAWFPCSLGPFSPQ